MHPQVLRAFRRELEKLSSAGQRLFFDLVKEADDSKKRKPWADSIFNSYLKRYHQGDQLSPERLAALQEEYQTRAGAALGAPAGRIDMPPPPGATQSSLKARLAQDMEERLYDQMHVTQGQHRLGIPHTQYRYAQHNLEDIEGGQVGVGAVERHLPRVRSAYEDDMGRVNNIMRTFHNQVPLLGGDTYQHPALNVKPELRTIIGRVPDGSLVPKTIYPMRHRGVHTIPMLAEALQNLVRRR